MKKNYTYKELFEELESTSKEDYFEKELRYVIKTYDGLIEYISKELEQPNLKAHESSSLTSIGKIVMVQANTATALANIIPFLREKLHGKLDDLPGVLDRKNHDYGNSFDQLVTMYGDVAMSIRVSDKMSRLRSLLIDKEEQQVDESVDDTLLDLAGYMLLTIKYDVKEYEDTHLGEKIG